MARPPINDGLSEFRDWMIDERLLSCATARSYTSHARTALRGLGEHAESPSAVDDHFAALHETHRSAYPVIFRAWKLYVEWRRETKGEEIPAPGKVTKLQGVVHQLKPLPDTVRDALRDLGGAAISLKVLSTLTWNEVALGGMMRAKKVHVRHPSRPGEMWLTPATAIRALYDYAQPGGNLCIPLVPLAPSSVHPYPHRGLVYESQQYTEEQVLAMIEGTKARSARTERTKIRQENRTERVKARSASRSAVAEATGETPSPVDNIVEAAAQIVPAVLGIGMPKFDVDSYKMYQLPDRKDLDGVALDGLGEDDDER